MSITTQIQPINESHMIQNKKSEDCAQVNLTIYEDGTFNFSVQGFNPTAFFEDTGNGGFSDITKVFNDFKKSVKTTRKTWQEAHPAAEEEPIIAMTIPSINSTEDE
ncbi:hypothetical protein OfM1_18770 [Lactovum odontotermitis]